MISPRSTHDRRAASQHVAAAGRELEPVLRRERLDRRLGGRRQLGPGLAGRRRQLRDHGLVARGKVLRLVDAVALGHHHEQLVVPVVAVLGGEELRVALGSVEQDRHRPEVVRRDDHGDPEREALLLGAREQRVDLLLVGRRDVAVVGREKAEAREQVVARRIAVGPRRRHGKGERREQRRGEPEPPRSDVHHRALASSWIAITAASAPAAKAISDAKQAE